MVRTTAFSLARNCPHSSSVVFGERENGDTANFLCDLETAELTAMSLDQKVDNMLVWLLLGQIITYLLTFIGNFIVVYAICAVKKFRR